MLVRNFELNDATEVLSLYNSCAPCQGYAQLTNSQFNSLVRSNKYFDTHFAFVLIQDNHIQGFVCGASNEQLPQGAQRGYFSCLVLRENTPKEFNALMDALEQAFKNDGRILSDILFFNPIRLPWLIPNTNEHIHNNAPGIWSQSPLYELMVSRGYVQRARECAMHLELNNFTLPAKLLKKQTDIAGKGYKICTYDGSKHTGVAEMLATLENPEWLNEISACAVDSIPFLVATHNNAVVGFAGPIYPENSGRGYFTGIGVVPLHEGNGLGTLLFYRLCEAEEKAGAKYMSLFTGEENPARKIYAGAGFEAVRTFAIMRKELI